MRGITDDTWSGIICKEKYDDLPMNMRVNVLYFLLDIGWIDVIGETAFTNGEVLEEAYSNLQSAYRRLRIKLLRMNEVV